MLRFEYVEGCQVRLLQSSAIGAYEPTPTEKVDVVGLVTMLERLDTAGPGPFGGAGYEEP